MARTRKARDVAALAEMAAALMRDKKCNCAEAIVRVMAERYGFDPALSRAVTPFGGGISGNADVCGLMTGGLVVIGLRFGRKRTGDQETKARCYAVGNELYHWFMTKYGRCTDLKGNPQVGPFDDCYRAASEFVPYLVDLIDRNERKGRTGKRK